MVNMNEDGPLFVRFHGDPRNVAAAELRSDVGFVVDGGAAPPAPLTMDRRPAEKVAYLLAPAPHGTTARFYGTLYDWARKNGYAAKGGPVEVYWERDQKGVVEIQLPVEPAKTKPEGPGQPPVTAGEPEAAAPLRPNGEEAPSPDRMGVDSFGTDPGGKSEEPAAASSTSHEGRDDGAGGNRAAERFDELFASREFDAIAVEVLPVREFDEATQAWVGQLAYRTLAIGRGLQQKFGEEGKPVHDLAEALLRRYRALLPPGADPLAVAGRASTQALDPARKELLRQADLLLGRIALGSVQPEAATQEVIQMLRDLARALTIE
jgi:hypothetical protein